MGSSEGWGWGWGERWCLGGGGGVGGFPRSVCGMCGMGGDTAGAPAGAPPPAPSPLPRRARRSAASAVLASMRAVLAASSSDEVGSSPSRAAGCSRALGRRG